MDYQGRQVLCCEDKDLHHPKSVDIVPQLLLDAVGVAIVLFAHFPAQACDVSERGLERVLHGLHTPEVTRAFYERDVHGEVVGLLY